MIVWANGCWDVLHSGHFNLLSYARWLADTERDYAKDCFLIVGIDSDEKIKRDKGSNRPIFSQEERKNNLLSLKYFATRPLVDEIYIFDSPTELKNLIKQVQPDAMIVGDDWKGKPVVGQEYIRKSNKPFGIHYYPRTPISSTEIINRCKKS